jgi:hypothetical protein
MFRSANFWVDLPVDDEARLNHSFEMQEHFDTVNAVLQRWWEVRDIWERSMNVKLKLLNLNCNLTCNVVSDRVGSFRENFRYAFTKYRQVRVRGNVLLNVFDVNVLNELGDRLKLCFEWS